MSYFELSPTIVKAKRLPRFSLNRLFSYLLFIVNMTPFLIRNCPRILQISICVLWVITAFLEHKLPFKNRKNNCVLFSIVLFEGLEFFYLFIGYSDAEIGNYLMHLMAYLSLISFLSLSEDENLILHKRMFFFLCTVIVINLCSNIYISFTQPSAFDQINYDWGSSFLKTNTAQTWFYCVVFLFVSFVSIHFFLLKNLRFVSIIALFPAVYFLFFVSPRATACIFTIFTFLAIFLFWIFKKRAKFALFLLLFIIFTAILFSNQIIHFLMDIIKSNRLRMRLEDIYLFISGSSNENGSFFERLQLIQLSLKTFFSSVKAFVFGIGYHVDSDSFVIGIGQHSSFFDCFPQYGLIGAFLFFYFIIESCKSLLSSFKDKLFLRFAKIMVFAFILYGFVNNFVNPGIFTAFYGFLSAMSVFERKRGKNI